ncbi:hypothetical protein THAOC_19674, partial [Thalassiosira oceanica]
HGLRGLRLGSRSARIWVGKKRECWTAKTDRTDNQDDQMIRTLTLTKRRMGWAGWRKGDVDDGLGVYRQWDGSDLEVLVGAQVGGA